jgi:hypothetical protein
MDLSPGRVEEMVRLSLKRDSFIPCHETLDGKQAICRGFYDRHRRDVLSIRLATALDMLRFVEKPE